MDNEVEAIEGGPSEAAVDAVGAEIRAEAAVEDRGAEADPAPIPSAPGPLEPVPAVAEKSAHELFYDAELRAELERLGKLCEARGLSFASFVDLGPNMATVTTWQPKLGSAAQLILAAFNSRGNVDALLAVIMQGARQVGHNSQILASMGIPKRPAPPPSTDLSPADRAILDGVARGMRTTGQLSRHAALSYKDTRALMEALKGRGYIAGDPGDPTLTEKARAALGI